MKIVKNCVSYARINDIWGRFSFRDQTKLYVFYQSNTSSASTYQTCIFNIATLMISRFCQSREFLFKKMPLLMVPHLLAAWTFLMIRRALVRAGRAGACTLGIVEFLSQVFKSSSCSAHARNVFLLKSLPKIMKQKNWRCFEASPVVSTSQIVVFKAMTSNTRKEGVSWSLRQIRDCASTHVGRYRGRGSFDRLAPEQSNCRWR